jgi:uncharacterized protein YlxP (DUF503 family)
LDQGSRHTGHVDARSRLKPLLARLHKEFNISTAEVGDNDHHAFAVVACVMVSNDARHAQRALDRIPDWVETHRPDLQIIDRELYLY